MGKVLTLLRVSGAEGQDLNELVETLKTVKGYNTAKIEDYVFGTKVIKASFICEDKDAVDFESVVSQLPGIGEVNVEEVGLI